ncbi:helix-turn-helix transcriptional regulator [Flavobacterium sp. TR2]|uniref:helix-turn-helix domain-containing protein n=1 Tax=Flavobacterium sp. TR2 TaxID=2977321 RepID=UPI0021B109B9|nr:helix-turn-helix transcriptional regulator [Flavobacterium sp. TR2]UWY27863.1 helix-turn-helix transcriptional regulator [Flavobacterium sp. TR2]
MEKKGRKSAINEEVVLLGTRITEIIKEKGLKTRIVAHDADLDVENLRKYMKGKQEMKITTMLKILKSLDVSIEELFNFIKAK